MDLPTSLCVSKTTTDTHDRASRRKQCHAVGLAIAYDVRGSCVAAPSRLTELLHPDRSGYVSASYSDSQALVALLVSLQAALRSSSPRTACAEACSPACQNS